MYIYIYIFIYTYIHTPTHTRALIMMHITTCCNVVYHIIIASHTRNHESEASLQHAAENPFANSSEHPLEKVTILRNIH